MKPRLLALALVASLLTLSITPAEAGTFGTNTFGQSAYLETFETKTSLVAPTDSEYSPVFTGSGTSSFVSETSPIAGTKSWFVADGGTNAAAGLSLTNFNPCSGSPVVEFKLKPVSFGTGTSQIGLQNSLAGSFGTTQNGFVITVSSTGVVSAFSQGSSSASATVALGLTMVTGTTYHFRMSGFNCASPAYTLAELTTEKSVTTGNAGGSISNNKIFRFGGAGGPNGQWRVDDLEFTLAVPIPSIPVTNQLALTNVIGAGSDNLISSIIVRHNGGSTVSTVNPLDNTIAASVGTPNCVTSGGVAAGQFVVVYASCDGAGLRTQFHVRSASLGTPDQIFNECSNTTQDFTSGANTVTDIVIADFVTFLNGDCYLSYAYNLNNAKVQAGVFSWDGQSAAAANSQKALTYAPSTDVDQYCHTQGNSFWASGATVKKYRIEPAASVHPFGSKLTQLGDTGLSGRFISCGQDRVAFTSGNNVVVLDEITAAPVRTINVGVQVEAALSFDGLWLATDNGRIYSVENGNLLGTFTPRSGGTVAIYIDRTGQNVWHVTSTGISRFEIFTVTTVTPTGSTAGSGFFPPGPGGPIGDLTGPRIPGFDLEIFETRGIMSKEAAGWFIGTMLVVTLTGGVAFAAPRGAVRVMAAGGFILGVALAMAFGLFPIWFLVFLFMLAAALVVLSRRGGGGEG